MDYMALARIVLTMVTVFVFFLTLVCMKKPEIAWKVFKVLVFVAMLALMCVALWMIWEGTLPWVRP